MTEELRFDPCQGEETLLFSLTSRSALGPTQSPVQWISKAASPGVKRPEHEADNSPPSSAEVKNGGGIPTFSHMCLFN
jgi:hypothetical protein